MAEIWRRVYSCCNATYLFRRIRLQCRLHSLVCFQPFPRDGIFKSYFHARYSLVATVFANLLNCIDLGSALSDWVLEPSKSGGIRDFTFDLDLLSFIDPHKTAQNGQRHRNDPAWYLRRSSEENRRRWRFQGCTYCHWKSENITSLLTADTRHCGSSHRRSRRRVHHCVPSISRDMY